MKNEQTRQVVVNSPQGLHARPAHMFVTVADSFQADIQVIRNGESVDGKSILSILTLGAAQGTELTLRALGEDAEAALDALESLFVGGFEQDEDAMERETSADGSVHSSSLPGQSDAVPCEGEGSEIE